MATKKHKRRRLKYFYFKDKLHRELNTDRGKDIIIAWSYPDNKRVGYTYSEVLRNHEKAFTTMQVCDMIGRRRTTVELAIVRGMIPRPQHSYEFTSKKMYAYFWNEKDIMNLHDYLSTVHRGRPRRDGLVIAAAMPSKRELRAIIRDNDVMYVKNDDGDFVPTWQAKL